VLFGLPAGVLQGVGGYGFLTSMICARLGLSLLVATALVPCALARTPEAIKPDMNRKPVQVMPQDDVLPATLDQIYLSRIDIDQALVVVELGQGMDNPQWIMSATQLEVLLDTLLQFMPEKPTVEDAIWPKLKRPDPKYRGVRIVLRTVWGRHFEPFTIFEGNVTAAGGRVMTQDYGRRMEYWMFGTSRLWRRGRASACYPITTCCWKPASCRRWLRRRSRILTVA